MRITSLLDNKWLLAGVAILLLIGLFAYTRISAQTEDQALIVLTNRAPKTLDARFATDATSVRMTKLLSHGLVQLDAQGKPKPLAAASVHHRGYQMFSFTLKNVQFHDGTPLTASFVKGFFESIRHPDTKSPLRGQLMNVDGIETRDNTVIFYLKKPSAYFWSTLEIPFTKPCDSTPETVCGLGSYRHQLTTQQNKTVLLDEDGQKLVFEEVKDPTVRLLRLFKGSADVVHNDVPEELITYAKNQGLTVTRAPAASYSYIGFNLAQGEVTNSLKLRQAIAHAIDKKIIIDTLLNGAATPAKSLLLPTHKAHWSAPEFDYNPEKASQLLKEAGYENGLELDLAITTNPFIFRLSQVLKQQLADVGITLNIEPAEWGTFYGHIKKGNFQSYILTWVGRFQPDIYPYLFHSNQMPPNGANRGRYQSAEMDALLDQLTAELDDTKRTQIAQKIQEKQHNDLIYIPLWRRAHSLITRSGITGCTIDAQGGYEGLAGCRK